MNLIKERIVVFVCATTGQGDEPDNMKVLKINYFNNYVIIILNHFQYCVSEILEIHNEKESTK